MCTVVFHMHSQCNCSPKCSVVDDQICSIFTCVLLCPARMARGCTATSTWCVRRRTAASATSTRSSLCWCSSPWSWPTRRWWWTSSAWPWLCRYATLGQRAASQHCPGLALLDLRVAFLQGRCKRVTRLDSFWNWSVSVHGAALPKGGEIYRGAGGGTWGSFMSDSPPCCPWFFSPQDLATDEALPVYNRCAIHALSAAYLNLICQLTTVPTFCQHVHEV